MLADIRKFAKSPFATALLGLLVVGFALFGISDVFKSRMTQNAVVKAGSRTIEAPEFKQFFDRNLKDIAQQQNNGQPITTEQAAAAGLDKAMVESLATSESLGALMDRMGLAPSDQQVVAELRKTQAFFDPVTGKFDQKAYLDRLQQAGLTAAGYERIIRDQLAQTQLVSGLASGLNVPRTFLAPIAAYNGESRSFTWFQLPPGLAGPPVKPTDADLAAFIKASAAQFTKPEMRQLSFVRFSAAEVAKTLPVSEADVQKRFNFEKDTLSSPETRSFVEVPVKDAATGAQVAARLKSGQDPVAVAKSIGVTDIAYVDAPKTAVSDRAVADQVYVPTLKVGDVAGPLKGSLGLAVVKVQKVTPGHQASLEDARPKIEAEVKKDAATDQVYKLVQAYDDARSGGANMAEAAKKANVPVQPLPIPITAQGTTLQGQQAGIPPKVLQAAFMLPQSGESEVIDLGAGEYAAVRVDKVMPSALATVDEVRGPATQLFVLSRMQKALQAKADEFTARIKKGEPIATVAGSIGAKPQTTDLRRDMAQQQQTLSADLVGKVFAAKPGETVVGQDVKLGLVVAKLDKVTTAPAHDLAVQVEAQRDAFREVVFKDISDLARNAARAEIKPKVDYDRARTAIGLEAQAPAAGAKK